MKTSDILILAGIAAVGYYLYTKSGTVSAPAATPPPATGTNTSGGENIGSLIGGLLNGTDTSGLASLFNGSGGSTVTGSQLGTSSGDYSGDDYSGENLDSLA